MKNGGLMPSIEGLVSSYYYLYVDRHSSRQYICQCKEMMTETTLLLIPCRYMKRASVGRNNTTRFVPLISISRLSITCDYHTQIHSGLPAAIFEHHGPRASSVGGRSWTASRHLLSRLDAVQSLLGPMQPGRHTLVN